MSDIIEKAHYRHLSDRNPQTVCGNALCQYDQASGSYTVSTWGFEYRICPHECKTEILSNTGDRPHKFFDLFVIQYLIGAAEVKPAGEWISEKDLPGGPTFFRGPHQIPTEIIADHFNNDVAAFKARCAQLHGKPVDMADAACVFEITPRIPAAVLYWIGDEDFPAEAKILYDITITRHLTADIVFALAVGICHRLATSSA